MNTFEIHLTGALPPWLTAQLSSMTVLEAPAQTMLVTDRLDQAGLQGFLGHLTDLGIELIELRQVKPWPREPRTGMSDPSGSRPGTYEVRVRGLLGPVMLLAVPHTCAMRLPHHTVVVAETDARRNLVEVLTLLLSTGLKVETVTVLPAGALSSSSSPGRARRARR